MTITTRLGAAAAVPITANIGAADLGGASLTLDTSPTDPQKTAVLAVLNNGSSAWQWKAGDAGPTLK
jgi:hypothetical protein